MPLADPHDVRAPRLPPASDGVRRVGLRRQGRAARATGRRDPAGCGRRTRSRPGAGRRHAGQRRFAADRPRARRAGRRPPGSDRGARSPAGSSCPKGRSATTCRPRSPRLGRATEPRPSGWPTSEAGSEAGSGQRLAEVGDQVVGVLDAAAEPHEVGRHRGGRALDRLVGHRLRHLDQRLDAAERLGEREQARARGDRGRARDGGS